MASIVVACLHRVVPLGSYTRHRLDMVLWNRSDWRRGYGNDFVHLEAEVAEEGAEQSRQEKRTESAGVQRAAELAHDIAGRGARLCYLTRFSEMGLVSGGEAGESERWFGRPVSGA